MTNAEMKNKFAVLYGTMVNSRKISNMKLFGAVMCEAMMSIIGTNSPEQIANAVYPLAKDKLCDEDGMFNIRQYFNV